MKKCVFSSSDQKYALKALVTLALFKKKNDSYDAILIGRKFSIEHHQFAKVNNIRLIQIDLTRDFCNHKGVYPVECFYIFAGPKLFVDYDYAIYIDGDIVPNLPVDFDYNSADFSNAIMATTQCTYSCSNWGPLKSDFATINRLWPNARWNANRLQSGVVIFNCERARSLSFYESVVRVYQTSQNHDIQRYGDDSLLTLWFMAESKPADVVVISGLYNNASTSIFDSETLIQKCFLFHCFDKGKPWDSHVPIRDCARKYFILKWQESACSLLGHDQIVTMFPHLDVTPTNNMAYYWYNKADNFGDYILPYYMNKVCGLKIISTEPRETDSYLTIVSCGSIYRLVNSRSIVCGSGIRDAKQDIKNAHTILSVRGPLTRKRVLEIGGICPPIYGDPGLLLPIFYSPIKKKKYRMGIIPHISQFDKIRGIYTEKVEELTIIDLRTTNIENVIDRILECEKIVSSSLHGIVASHAYGIPVQWIAFDTNINGDGTKYHDHFGAMGIENVKPIDALNYSLISTEKLCQMVDYNNVVTFDTDRLFDSMFFDRTGIKKLYKYLSSSV